MVEAFTYLVAGAPFVVAGVALLGLRWPAVWAGLAALAAALAGAVLWPGLRTSGLQAAFVEGFRDFG
jgi:L-lactate permease